MHFACPLRTRAHRLTADPFRSAAALSAARLQDLVTSLDREANLALQVGQATLAERLSSYAAELRSAAA